METPKQLVREADVANRLDLAVTTLRKWRSYDRGPKWVKIGGAVRYDSAEIDRYIASHSGGGDQ